MRTLFGTLLLLLTSTVAQAQFGTQFVCDQRAMVSNITTSGSTLLVAPPGFRSVRICAVYMQVLQPVSAPANFKIVYGTGATCGTGTGDLMPAWLGTASAQHGFSFVVPETVAYFAPQGTSVCFNLSAAPTGASVMLFYALN